MKRIKVGDKIWLKANKAEGWKRERVVVTFIQGPDYPGMLEVEAAHGEVLEVHIDQVEVK